MDCNNVIRSGGRAGAESARVRRGGCFIGSFSYYLILLYGGMGVIAYLLGVLRLTLRVL
jgi:hypothetical protein